MARPLKPLVHSGGWYPSKKWIPLVRNGGYTTQNGGEQPEPEAVLKTVTGSLIHITDALALPAEALSVNVEPIQAGTGDPSPENVRPISGRTSATVTRTGKNLVNKADGNQASNNWFIGSNRVNTGADGSFMLNAGTYTFSVSDTPSGMYVTNSSNVNIKTAYDVPQITFSIAERMPIKLNIYKSGSTSEYWNAVNIQLELGSTASAYEPYQGNTYTIQLGETVYGGTLDVTGGKMVVDRAMVHLLDFDFSTLSSPSSHIFRATYMSVIPNVLLPKDDSATWSAICSSFAYKPYSPISASDNGKYAIAKPSTNRLVFIDHRCSSVEDFVSLNSSVELVYPLATPIEITLTPTQIDMLLGENNLWADAGDSTLTYYADGNASTSEALGILLGGTYNNPGGADDVSDDEALGILLGGS